MSEPLSNRLDKLEADALQSMPVGHNFHIINVIVSLDGSVREELKPSFKMALSSPHCG